MECHDMRDEGMFATATYLFLKEMTREQQIMEYEAELHLFQITVYLRQTIVYCCIQCFIRHWYQPGFRSNP